MIPIFIGYDPREPVVYHVCCNSIIRHTTEPVCFYPLALNLLDGFYREYHKDGSNDFIYTRFLVPCLMDFVGHAIYLDGDMLVTRDIAELWNQRSYMKAVQVVKHDYKTKAAKKYLGSENQNYPCKNWSSVILWNCGHYSNRSMTPEFIQKRTGAELHRFTWLPPDRIGELPREWNWLESEYPKNPDAGLIHYTLGAPCFPEYANTDTSDAWKSELRNCLTPVCLPGFGDSATRQPSSTTGDS